MYCKIFFHILLRFKRSSSTIQVKSISTVLAYEESWTNLNASFPVKRRSSIFPTSSSGLHVWPSYLFIFCVVGSSLRSRTLEDMFSILFDGIHTRSVVITTLFCCAGIRCDVSSVCLLRYEEDHYFNAVLHTNAVICELQWSSDRGWPPFAPRREIQLQASSGLVYISAGTGWVTRYLRKIYWKYSARPGNPHWMVLILPYAGISDISLRM
jgi:hypothetical protein